MSYFIKNPLQTVKNNIMKLSIHLGNPKQFETFQNTHLERALPLLSRRKTAQFQYCDEECKVNLTLSTSISVGKKVQYRLTALVFLCNFIIGAQKRFYRLKRIVFVNKRWKHPSQNLICFERDGIISLRWKYNRNYDDVSTCQKRPLFCCWKTVRLRQEKRGFHRQIMNDFLK